jgi:hypothetical protein
MAFRIDMPPSNADQRTLYAYLYKLSSALNVAMNSLDGSNMNANYQQQIAAVVEVTDKAKALAELLDNGELSTTKTVRDLYHTLRDSVFSNMENITASFDSLIEQTSNEIKTYVEANFIATDTDMSLEETISSMIQQTADQIRLEFNTQAEINADAINELAIQFGTYFSFTETGLEIGLTGDGASGIVARITNERLEFAIAGTDVVLAYFDGATNQLKINSAEIDTLSIGNDVSGYVDANMTADGLFLNWRT